MDSGMQVSILNGFKLMSTVVGQSPGHHYKWRPVWLVLGHEYIDFSSLYAHFKYFLVNFEAVRHMLSALTV